VVSVFSSGTVSAIRVKKKKGEIDQERLPLNVETV